MLLRSLAASSAANCRAVVPLPAFVARAAFGEMADETLLASTRALPARLEASGFTFRHRGFEPALLQERLDSAGYELEVINAGVPGDTTAGGVSANRIAKWRSEERRVGKEGRYRGSPYH